jgi:hypothetical protein
MGLLADMRARLRVDSAADPDPSKAAHAAAHHPKNGHQQVVRSDEELAELLATMRAALDAVPAGAGVVHAHLTTSGEEGLTDAQLKR